MLFYIKLQKMHQGHDLQRQKANIRIREDFIYLFIFFVGGGGGVNKFLR